MLQKKAKETAISWKKIDMQPILKVVYSSAPPSKSQSWRTFAIDHPAMHQMYRTRHQDLCRGLMIPDIRQVALAKQSNDGSTLFNLLRIRFGYTFSWLQELAKCSQLRDTACWCYEYNGRVSRCGNNHQKSKTYKTPTSTLDNMPDMTVSQQLGSQIPSLQLCVDVLPTANCNGVAFLYPTKLDKAGAKSGCSIHSGWGSHWQPAKVSIGFKIIVLWRICHFSLCIRTMLPFDMLASKGWHGCMQENLRCRRHQMPAAVKEATENDDRNIFVQIDAQWWDFSTKVKLHGTGGTLPLLTEPCHPQRFSCAMIVNPHGKQTWSNVHQQNLIWKSYQIFWNNICFECQSFINVQALKLQGTKVASSIRDSFDTSNAKGYVVTMV